MGFLYYIPGHARGTVTAADFRTLGLDHALTVGDPTSLAIGKGPDGGAGMIGVPEAEGDPTAAGFDAGRQTWRKGPGGRFWVGYWNDAKPGPEHLRRRAVHGGTTLALLDGHEWIVPRCVAMIEDRRPDLPYVLDLDDDGETPLGRIHPRYEALCRSAFDWWLTWTGQRAGDAAMGMKDRVKLVAEALAVNYRVSRVEAVGLLRLFSETEIAAALRILIDADAVEARVTEEDSKKSE